MYVNGLTFLCRAALNSLLRDDEADARAPALTERAVAGPRDPRHAPWAVRNPHALQRAVPDNRGHGCHNPMKQRCSRHDDAPTTRPDHAQSRRRGSPTPSTAPHNEWSRARDATGSEGGRGASVCAKESERAHRYGG